MPNLDFSNFSNEELLRMEEKVDKEVTKAVTELIYNENLLDTMKELEEIREEKRRRNING